MSTVLLANLLPSLPHPAVYVSDFNSHLDWGLGLWQLRCRGWEATELGVLQWFAADPRFKAERSCVSQAVSIQWEDGVCGKFPSTETVAGHGWPQIEDTQQRSGVYSRCRRAETISEHALSDSEAWLLWKATCCDGKLWYDLSAVCGPRWCTCAYQFCLRSDILYFVG